VNVECAVWQARRHQVRGAGHAVGRRRRPPPRSTGTTTSRTSTSPAA